ncbi:hypothetical protein [Pseudonocardia pini]|uniref:hypothetical protein n=1 Tax=Pseudonocardia pini TaxID=2758030 RepID=UPI0015EFEC7D|nr:hypothetical protein [Pseudonocardia pini]
MGRHSTTGSGRGRGTARLTYAAVAGAVLVGGGTALLPGTDEAAAAPLTVTVTGPTAPLYTCDLQSPPAFTDPAEPDTITNRACSYVDDLGRERSFDPWIDGQLLHAAR